MSGSGYKKAFDIGRIPKDLDLSVPPVTGFDYLYRVRLETRKCPKVVVSNMDTTRFLARQTILVDPCNGFVRARIGFAPEPSWQDEQMKTFLSTRMEIFNNREEMKAKFPKRALPKIGHEKDWCSFCLGSTLSDKIFESKISTDGIKVEDSAMDEITEVKQPKSKKTRYEAENAVREANAQLGNPPLLSIMLYLNQTRITRLLAFHIRWMEAVGFSDAQGSWLYALLLCLEKPLDPDTCALLRSLSRVCSKFRGDLLSPEDKLLKALNLILTIVSRCFDQKDMSDCFFTD